ncbi:glycosyltransferase family 2 protein [Candidatus Gottesmanbacteria bacterium]|nr:glycosyltransferase family 2 protein [Candidatus Gottesmanbacteria bacterium]
MNKIFIIIPTYNGLKDTFECLKTISKLNYNNQEIKTVIVDNASTDKTPEFLEKEKSKYNLRKIFKNNKNLGFAKACNIGIKYALENNADYILLLNSDVVIDQNFLPSLIDSDLDIISPVVQFPLDPDGKDYRYDYGGYVNWWTGRTYHDDRKVFSKRHRGTSDVKTPPRWPARLPAGREGTPRTVEGAGKPEYIPVDYMSGCSLLIKAEVFRKIGLFDEKFFMYFEDVDFCVRAKKAGFRVAVDPQSLIFHKLGGSIKRWSTKAIYYNISSNAIFILKYCGIKTPIALGYLSLLTAKIIMDKILYKLDARR